MNWKQFVAQIVTGTAWPVIVIIIILIFKTEFAKIIQRLAHLKYKDLELEFEKVKQQTEELQKDVPEDPSAPKSPVFISLEDQILDAVEIAPSTAILLAWSSMEAAMASAIERLAISSKSQASGPPRHAIEWLSRYGELPRSYADLLHQMRILRNKVVHEREAMLSITQDQAQNYANSVIDMIHRLEQLK